MLKHPATNDTASSTVDSAETIGASFPKQPNAAPHQLARCWPCWPGSVGINERMLAGAHVAIAAATRYQGSVAA